MTIPKSSFAKRHLVDGTKSDSMASNLTSSDEVTKRSRELAVLERHYRNAAVISVIMATMTIYCAAMVVPRLFDTVTDIHSQLETEVSQCWSVHIKLATKLGETQRSVLHLEHGNDRIRRQAPTRPQPNRSSKEQRNLARRQHQQQPRFAQNNPSVTFDEGGVPRFNHQQQRILDPRSQIKITRQQNGLQYAHLQESAPVQPPRQSYPTPAPSGSCCTCNQGRAGPAGRPGNPGRDGRDGQAGFPGPNGGSGPTNNGPYNRPTCENTCAESYPGFPGEPGLKGPKGPPGDPGYSAGPAQPGQDGYPGQQGRPGTPGRPGAPGRPGQPGNVRRVPAQPGPPGQPGRPGEKGNPGYDGKPGNPPQPGYRGEIGLRGDPGQAGKPGYQGPPGQAGYRGSEGSCTHCQYVKLPPGYTTGDGLPEYQPASAPQTGASPYLTYGEQDASWVPRNTRLLQLRPIIPVNDPRINA